jgi:ATP-dependent exoDNAse (exonuclease V) alpha subunit
VGGQCTHPPWQLYRLCKAHTALAADVVVLDEAGQLGVAQAALVLRALRPGGRIVIAGDSEQLAPIRAGAYPAADAPLFGSVLDVVMHRSLSPRERAAAPRPQPLARAGSGITASQESTIVQLTENFRCAGRGGMPCDDVLTSSTAA